MANIYGYVYLIMAFFLILGTLVDDFSKKYKNKILSYISNAFAICALISLGIYLMNLKMEFLYKEKVWIAIFIWMAINTIKRLFFSKNPEKYENYFIAIECFLLIYCMSIPLCKF